MSDWRQTLGRVHDARGAFVAAVLGLTAILTLPVWIAPRLPLQDYPQHLFMALLYSGAGAPDLDWSAYTVVAPAKPYALFFWVMAALCRWFAPDTAGRLVVTGIQALYAVVALRWGLQRAGEPARWPALALPLVAIHPLFFLGFLNFLLAVPLVLLALTDLWRVRDGGAAWPHRLALGVALVAVTFTHPVGLAAFTLLGAASLVTGARERSPGWWFAATSVALAAALTLGWAGPSAASGGAGGITWRAPSLALHVLALTFNAMNPLGSLDLAAALWAALLAALAASAVRTPSRVWTPLLPAGAALVALVALPFAVGAVTYVSVRMIPWALALTIAGLSAQPTPSTLRAGPAVALLCLALAVRAAVLMGAVGAEAGQIDPVLAGLRPNARLLPLIFDGSSERLDPGVFHQLHAHEPFYAATTAGGGVVAGLFYTQLLPVRYRDGVGPPAPFALRPDRFTWEQHGRFYDFVLTRGAPDAFLLQLDAHFEAIVRSGPWVLLARRAGGATPPR